MRNVIGLAVATIVPFLLAGAFLTSPSATGVVRTGAAAVDHLPQSAPEPAMSEAGAEDFDARGDEEAAVDMMGNQVTDAVAKYQFDATGSLYELHSPQTELPRLKPPKS